MATMNPFDLLGDDAEDPSQLIAVEQLKAAAPPPPKKPVATEQGKQRGAAAQPLQNKPAQLPSKSAPPAQAVRVLLMKEMLGGLQKDVAMVDHQVPIVVVVDVE